MKKKKWVYIVFAIVIVVIIATILILVFAFPPPALTVPNQAYSEAKTVLDSKETYSVEETADEFLSLSGLSLENRRALQANKNIFSALEASDAFLSQNLAFMERSESFNGDANSVVDRKNELSSSVENCQSYIEGTLKEFFELDTKSSEDINSFCITFLERYDEVTEKFVSLHEALAQVVNSSAIAGYDMNDYSKAYLQAVSQASRRVLGDKTQSADLLNVANTYSAYLGYQSYDMTTESMLSAFESIAVEVTE